MSITLTDRLTSAVRDGNLKSWEIIDVDEDGIEGRLGRFRNTQTLRLEFPDNKILEVGTFCSGSAEDTVLT